MAGACDVDISALLLQAERLGLDEASAEALRGQDTDSDLIGAWLAGLEVRLTGLKSATLNGRTGVVLDQPRQGERLAVLLHERRRPRPADWTGGSWTVTAPPKPIAVRPRNLRLLAPACLAPSTSACSALGRVLASRVLSARILSHLLLEPSMASLTSAAASCKALCLAAATLIAERNVLVPLRAMGGEGSDFGQLRAPSSVAALADGTICVGDEGNRRLQLITIHGETRRLVDGRFTVGMDRHKYTRLRMTYVPRGVAAGPAGSLLVVGRRDEADWDDPDNEQAPTTTNHWANLLQLDVQEKRISLECGADADDSCGGGVVRQLLYDAPSRVVYTIRTGVSPSGLVRTPPRVIGLEEEYLDAAHVETYWSGGAFELPTGAGTDAPLLVTPTDIAADAHALYVSDEGAACVLVFDRLGPSGRFGALERRIGRRGGGAGEFETGPTALTVDADGRLLVCEERRVQVLTTAGVPLQIVAPPEFISLRAIAATRRHVAIADAGAHVVHVLALGSGARDAVNGAAAAAFVHRGSDRSNERTE